MFYFFRMATVAERPAFFAGYTLCYFVQGIPCVIVQGTPCVIVQGTPCVIVQGMSKPNAG